MNGIKIGDIIYVTNASGVGKAAGWVGKLVRVVEAPEGDRGTSLPFIGVRLDEENGTRFWVNGVLATPLMKELL